MAERFEVRLPELGEDAGDTATVSYWQVEVGDTVAEEDDLVEMTTDKAVFSVPSPVSGKLVEIVAQEGEEVKVGDLLAIIEVE